MDSTYGYCGWYESRKALNHPPTPIQVKQYVHLSNGRQPTYVLRELKQRNGGGGAK